MAFVKSSVTLFFMFRTSVQICAAAGATAVAQIRIVPLTSLSGTVTGMTKLFFLDASIFDATTVSLIDMFTGPFCVVLRRRVRLSCVPLLRDLDAAASCIERAAEQYEITNIINIDKIRTSCPSTFILQKAPCFAFKNIELIY